MDQQPGEQQSDASFVQPQQQVTTQQSVQQSVSQLPIVTQPAVQQTVVVESPYQQNPLPKIPNTNPSKKILFIVLVLIASSIIIGGLYYLLLQKDTISNLLTRAKISPTSGRVVNSSSTLDPTANWKSYVGDGFSLLYPDTWVLRPSKSTTNPSVIDISIYNPGTSTTLILNGGKVKAVPYEYVDIRTDLSSQTPKQYADKVISNPAYVRQGSVIQPITLGGQSGYIYKEAGEGSRGFDIVISDGTKLLIINIPYRDITQNITIYNILKSFKFT